MRKNSQRFNREFKTKMADSLRTMASVLQASELLRDPSPLFSAASVCTGTSPERESWEYYCTNLVFRVSNGHLKQYRNSIPGNLREIVITLGVHARGKCLSDESHDDPFDALEVDCMLEASTQDRDPFVCAWHLDRNEGDASEASRHFVHPCYHFQFGGRRLPTELGYGQFLLIDPPRLAHPPLDAILAIDFVLTNYFPDTWQKLRSEDLRYVRVVEAAQHRCWRPYATTIASRWGSGDPPWAAEAIWPQLVPNEAITRH